MARAAQLREQAERARCVAAQAESDRERTIALARAERREEAARAVESGGTAADATDGDEAGNEGEASCSDCAFPDDAPKVAAATAEQASTPQQEMRAKVASPEGQEIYRRRKCIVEPVFGQIKEAMGFRRLSMRGMDRARGEWALVCTCHNIRKLWVARRAERLSATD